MVLWDEKRAKPEGSKGEKPLVAEELVQVKLRLRGTLSRDDIIIPWPGLG